MSEEEEKGMGSPRSLDSNRKKWTPCRASLLDNQEEDDDDSGHKEPDLMCLSDVESDETRTDKELKPPQKETNDDMQQDDEDRDCVVQMELDDSSAVRDENDAAIESLALLTEGVASMLCPTAYDVKRRTDSETDFFQLHSANTYCGSTSTVCWNPMNPYMKATNSALALEEMEYQNHAPELRNRCAVRAAQSRRVQALWNNWHSTPGDNSSSSEGHVGHLTPRNLTPRVASPKGWNICTTKSLGGELEVQTNYSSLISPITTDHNAFTFSDVVMMKTSATPQSITPNIFDTEGVSDLYYDSDPEVFGSNREDVAPAASDMRAPLLLSRSRSEPTVMSTRRRLAVPPPINTQISTASDVVPPLTPRNTGSRQKASDVIADSEAIDIHDDEVILEFIRELTVGTVTLVWHPSPEDCENSKASGSPVSVQGWFEMGSLLSTKLVQPKFMWRSTYHPDLEGRKRLNLSSTTPHSIELLSILRILKPEAIDRSLYPFCKLDQTFTLSSHAKKLCVFEASSQQERDRFVQGLKIVVARLASMIIVGDDHVFAEFFSPLGAHSPRVVENQATEQALQETEEQIRHQDEVVGQERVTSSKLLSTTEKERNDLWGKSFFG